MKSKLLVFVLLAYFNIYAYSKGISYGKLFGGDLGNFIGQMILKGNSVENVLIVAA